MDFQRDSYLRKSASSAVKQPLEAFRIFWRVDANGRVCGETRG